MKIKVCGMKFSENVSNLVDIGIDYVGFIKWQKSTRFSSNTPKISDSIKKVGVFVDSPISEIKYSIKKNNFDLVQLHGNESIDYCHSLKGSSLIIKAFNIDEKFCFSKLECYDDVCDYFLFDSNPQDLRLAINILLNVIFLSLYSNFQIFHFYQRLKGLFYFHL